MAFAKITDSDLKGKGNVGRPDTPGVTTAEMQRILDEIPREVIVPALNALIDALGAQDAAENLGAVMPEGLTDKGNTVQSVLNALLARDKAHEERTDNPHKVTAVQTGAYTIEQTDTQIATAVAAHADRTDNPHGVTASQVGAYTKAETEAQIDKKVQAIGGADMVKAVYDPQDKATDIFSVIQYFSEMSITNSWESPLADNDGSFLLDDDGFVLLADWKYKEA